MKIETISAFEHELEKLLNRYSRENESNTPDFILARYLMDCLIAWNVAVRDREEWYGRSEQQPVTAGSGLPPESRE